MVVSLLPLTSKTVELSWESETSMTFVTAWLCSFGRKHSKWGKMETSTIHIHNSRAKHFTYIAQLKVIKFFNFLRENHQTEIVPCVFCATAMPSTTRIVTSNTDERNWTGKTSVILQSYRPFSAVPLHANPGITDQNNSEHTKRCN